MALSGALGNGALGSTGHLPSSATSPGDPFWSQVNGLWLWNGNATDSSTTGTVLTNNGGVTFGAYNPSIGGGSAIFSGTNYLSNTTSTSFEYASSYTLEWWINPTANGSLATGAYPVGVGIGTAGVWSGGATGASNFTLNALVLGTGILTSTIPCALSTWTHCAIVKNGTTYTIYIGGLSGGTATNSTALTSLGMSIGGRTDGNSNTLMTGQVGPVRFTAAARYTAPFIPPTSFPTHG